MQPSPDAELLASHSMANRAICPAIGLPVPTYLPIYLSIHPSVYLSIYLLSIYLSSQPTVSLSDVFTSFGIQISTVETPFCMLLILFQTPQNITFSHVNATCLSPIALFLFPDVKPFAKCAKHYLFTSKCNLCVSGPVLLYSLRIPKCGTYCLFKGKSYMRLSSNFSYSLICNSKMQQMLSSYR